MESQPEVSRFIPQSELFVPDYEGYVPLFVHGSHVFGRVRAHGRLWMVKSIVESERGLSANIVRLRKEFEIGVNLNHPGVVRMVDFADIPGAGLSIVMEDVGGSPLDRYLADEKPGKPRRLQLTEALIDAVAYIHSCGITHLDLKPANILVCHAGYPVRLIDFGLSDSADFAVLKKAGGTPEYAAPEQFADGYEADTTADVWSLATVIKRMSLPGVPRWIIHRCLNPNPAHRYPTACELREAIRSYRRRRSVAAWGVTVILSAAIVAGVAIAVGDKPKPVKDESEGSAAEFVSENIAVAEPVIATLPETAEAKAESPAYSDIVARHDALVADIARRGTLLLDSMEAVFELDSVPMEERGSLLAAAFGEFMRESNGRMFDFKSGCPEQLLRAKVPEWVTIYASPIDKVHRRYTTMLRQIVADASH